LGSAGVGGTPWEGAFDRITSATLRVWVGKFGVSKERLLEAVRKVGYSPQAIGRELKRVSKDRAAGGGPGKARSGR